MAAKTGKSGAGRTLRLGYLDPFQPFCSDAGGVARGTLVDALMPRLPPGVLPEWQPGPLPALPVWLAEGRIDAILGKAVTADRDSAFTFSTPLLFTAAALFGRPGQVAPHPSAAGGARIATPAAGPLVAALRTLAPRAHIQTVTDYEAAIAAVETGDADWAALNADVTAAQWPGRTAAAGPRFADLGLAVAVPHGDPFEVLPALGLTSGGAGTAPARGRQGESPDEPDPR